MKGNYLIAPACIKEMQRVMRECNKKIRRDLEKAAKEFARRMQEPHK
jgi:hypothetical protein